MRKTSVAFLCVLALVSCDSSNDGHDPIPEPSSSKGLVIEQRTLPPDSTVVEPKPEGSGKAGGRWSYQCDYSRPISLEEAWKQRFRVIIRNVSIEALEFDVTISQYDADDEGPIRRRQLGKLVIPPLTEKRFSGFMLNPRKPGEKICEVELVSPGQER